MGGSCRPEQGTHTRGPGAGRPLALLSRVLPSLGPGQRSPRVSPGVPSQACPPGSCSPAPCYHVPEHGAVSQIRRKDGAEAEGEAALGPLCGDVV